MFLKYPMALYQGGDAAQALVIVGDEAEEAARREEGFRMVGEPAPEPQKAPEPPKQPEGEGGDAAQDEPEPSPSTETALAPTEPTAATAAPVTARKRAAAQQA